MRMYVSEKWIMMNVILYSMMVSMVIGFTTINRKSHHPLTVLYSTAPKQNNNLMGGVDIFESWFPTTKNKKKQMVRHALFDSNTLRGLEYIGKDEDDTILTVPSSLVLSTTFDENWDVNLAMTLLNECAAGPSSPMYGYCALLCQGTEFAEETSLPPWTAPHALRHWSNDELAVLQSNKRGKKLVSAMEQQREDWSTKYRSLVDTTKFSKEQFVWAMEAVHSRAFCGDFGFASPTSSMIRNFSIPFSFTAFAINYMLLQSNNDNLLLTVLLALIGFSPLLINVSTNRQGDAVLLPFIDSANHVQEAQSIIEFDPLQRAFSLTIGRNCLIQDNNNKEQLVISYGAKRDSELLLNYGFLPGIQLSTDDDNDDDDDESNYRLRLANAYINA